jgi:quercetin dioxygenase-like cupin family protein
MANVENLSKPIVVSASDAPLLSGKDVPAGANLRRLFTRRDHGSLMNVGIYEFEPGDASRWWSTQEEPWDGNDVLNVGPVHEMLYVLSGTLTVETPGGQMECGQGTATLIPGEGRFRMLNTSQEPARVLYCLTPTIL